MSTYEYTDRDEDTLVVDTGETDYPSVYLDAPSGVYIPNEDAPALALAILEAAGYTGDDNYSVHTAEGAVRVLRRHIEEQTAKKAEAEEAKKLDEEAKALCDSTPYGDWDTNSDNGKDFWRGIARKARELHGEGK
jgi:hypothetical protein